MISAAEIETYRREGYLVLPDVLTVAEVEELRSVTDEFVERSRAITKHTEMFDLEDGHTPSEPRLRRIPMPNEPTRAVWLTVHKDLRRSPPIRAILDYLTEMFRSEAHLLRYGLRKG